MKRSQPERSEIVEAAFAALRETSVPDGPSPEVSSAILEARNGSASDLQPITLHKRKITTKRMTKIAIVAAVLVGVWIGVTHVVTDRNGSVALAEVYEHLQQAKTVTWTNVFYQNISSKDEKSTWVETSTMKCMYKAPGQERTVYLDKNGRPERITIEDSVRGMRLTLFCKKKKATLTYLGEPSEHTLRNLTDFFTVMSKRIDANAESLGKKQINGREASGFRVNEGDALPWNWDLWVDVETKRLVLIHKPGTDKYDPDTDPARSNPPGKKGWLRRAMGSVRRDIVYNRELDDSLFSLDPPDGYAVVTTRIPEPAEEDMIEWLGLQAHCNDNVFWDDPSAGREPMKRIADKFNQGKELTPAEEKVLSRSMQADTHHPIRRFAERTVGDSWHYTGKAVKLGDKDSPVCWYKPKDSTTYRVVYGDLSVKDVPPEDLPKTDGPE